jgi:hypothetical protein
MTEKILEEIKKLSPEERIERLRNFQEKQKQEAVEATKIIKDSVAQIKQEEKLKKIINVPETRKLSVTELFKPGESNLEETVEKTKRELNSQELQEHREYQTKLSQEPAQELYQRVKNMYEEVKEGNIGYDKMSELDDLNYALDDKQRDMRSGTYKTSGEQIEDMMNASKSLVNYMRKGR